ncbi:MAG: DinB family protein [Armatimonadota bacterium]
MEFKSALAGQYRATLAMLLQCVERCPDAIWVSGGPERPFWRIAYHAAFYTHLYLMPTEHDFVAWEKHIDEAASLWGKDNTPVDAFSKADLTNYIKEISESVTERLTAIDLDAQTSGFHWYNIPKLDHVLLNLRHLGIHVGQLQERLYAEGIDLDWISVR